MSPRRPRAVSAALAFVAACALAAAPAGAVIVATGDGTGNTSAPEDDFGFAWVGNAVETAVYVGNGWVVTANHVDEAPVTLPSGTFVPVPGSKRRLQNVEPGVSSDVALFRLQEPVPELPALLIRATPPEVGQLVVLMGHGPNRGDPTEFGGHEGWHWGDGHALRWGTSRVHALHPVVQAGAGDRTVAFSTQLSPVDPTDFEAGVGLGDSGGGAFIRDGDRWELAGVLFAASTYDDQPARTTLFGNLSYAADLSHYRDQLLAIAGLPACRDGLDDDGDGLVDFPADPDCRHADDRQERSACEREGVPGDADGDGVADGRDYTLWTLTFGHHAPEGTGADLDCDGLVGPDDFAIWRDAYRPAPAQAPEAAQAPEGACGQGSELAWLVLPLLLARHRRRAA